MRPPIRTGRRRAFPASQLALFAAALSLVTVLPALPAVADEISTTPADPLLAARAEALSTGKTVPVDAVTTEVSTTEALPDGTFTNTTSALPTRVFKDGEWTSLDPTLVSDGHGGYAPTATPNGVTLSGGGDGPLVTLTHADGPSMALTLPFTLPKPDVSGDTALYPSVLPGVDLSVSVTDQGGFSDVLVVHDQDAAANPELKKLTLAADTHGLDLATTDGDTMTATAADGDLAYTSPQPVMWDSGTTPTPSKTDGPAAELTSSVDGPGPGADTEPVAMTATSKAVTLTPDAGMLTDSDTTYPVYIDKYTNPDSSTAGHYTEVYSSSACDNSPQYDKAQTNGQGAGYQRWGGACGVGLERSYWAINTSGLHSSFVVYDAYVKISTTFAASYNCSQNQPLTLHTTNAISSSTDWLSRPGVHDTAFPPVTDTVPSGANSGSSCSNSTATFHVKDQAQKIADQDGNGYDANGIFGDGTNTWTIGLYGNESQTSGNDDYLRMSTTLTLTTKFDIPPGIPSNLHTTPPATGASAACTTSGVGWIGATTYSDAGSDITLHSTVTSQISGENVKAHYYVWDRTVDPDLDGNGASVSTPDSAFLASGTDAAMKIGATLKDGHQYGWDVYAEDDSPDQNLTSGKSDHCWFNTDFTAPPTPDISGNPAFPQVGTARDGDPVYAGPGKTTNFTVAGTDSPASDDSCTPSACKSSGMASFLWQLDSPPTAADSHPATVSGTDSQGRSTATIPVPIQDWGVHTLYVAGVDKAGNISTSPASYTFTVPWDPATTIKPGDISGDGVPDLLATTKTGDLDLIPGDRDPAQATTPVHSDPVTGTPPTVTGPVTVSTKEDSPDGTGWDNYLIAHRGNLHGANGDDLWAYNKTNGNLYIVKNDLDPVDDSSFPRTPWSTFGGFVHKRFDHVVKDACAPSDVVADDTRCRSTDYDSKNWNVSQLIAPGNVFGNTNDYPAVITVENKELWIYQSDGGYHLKNPILLGDGDWTGQNLIAAGTFKGKPVLWSRDKATGDLYSYPITIDPTTLVPTLLHPTTHTSLRLTLPPTVYPVVASPGDVNSPVQTGDTNPGGPDGIPDLYTVDAFGQLVEYNYRQSPVLTSPPTYDFAPPVSLGSVTDTATHWWKLAEGTGATTADSTGTLNATLSGAYSWTTDTTRGNALNLSGTTGYGSTTGPALDTSKSFTVSAWVKLNSLTANSTFLSQNGTTNNGFQLYYSSGAQVWAFGRHSTDASGAVWRAAYGSKAATGKWTHLVGIYDASTKEIRLYVDGKLTATRDWTYTPWNATGPLQIGRKLSSGTYGEYTNGAISDVRVYPFALPPADAAAGSDLPKVAQLD
ncbi:LamG domain-containing protein [Streptomyces olivochromogenes]|uniref:LamG domain-containing protein n=1 Tax=Streptomyces olivochromogenes TaxID=1963 RepID=UPI001F299601|nr:LamG domain-containing protein [Streptomyces olivochromogenes]MCF3135572.1 LamG domain-containing protein [Streptomyces olivochromogenes]